MPSPTRRQLAARLRDLAGLRRDQEAFAHGLVRGRCAGKRCASRLAIPQVTYDFRSEREVEVAAELVCAACDRVWSRTAVPTLSRHKDVQRHRLLLILPPKDAVRTWVSRGHVHREGDDAQIVRDATYWALLEAWQTWHKRNDRFEAAKERRRERERARKETEMAEWRAREAAIQARIREREAAARELGIA